MTTGQGGVPKILRQEEVKGGLTCIRKRHFTLLAG